MSNKLVFTVLLFATILLIPASSFSNSPSPLMIEKFVSSVYAQKESSFNSNMAFQLPDLKIENSNALSQNLSQSESFDSSELSESSESSTTETIESISSDSTTTTSTAQSSSTQSNSNNNNNNNMITSSYFADKDNVQYSYHYPLKNEYVDDDNIHKQIKECNSCFISELKKLHDKQLADQILKEIKDEFGDIINLCKLIVNRDIDRDQLENILYNILFGNKDHYSIFGNEDHYSSNSDSYYYNQNQYKPNNEYEMIEKKYQYENEKNNQNTNHYNNNYDNKQQVNVYSYPSSSYENEKHNDHDNNKYKNSHKYIQE